MILLRPIIAAIAAGAIFALAPQWARAEEPKPAPAKETPPPPFDAARAEKLIEQLAAATAAERLQAADELAAAGGQAVPFVLKHTKDKNETLRQGIAGVLGRIRTKQTLDALYELLGDKSDAVRRRAICSVGEHRSPESIGKIKDFLLNKNALLRQETVMSLGRIADASSLALVKRSCLDDDRVVRQAAAVALGLIKDRSAIPDVIALLRDDDKTVRTIASVVLKQLSGADFGFNPADDEPKRAESIQLWETWWKANEKSDTGGNTGNKASKKE